MNMKQNVKHMQRALLFAFDVDNEVSEPPSDCISLDWRNVPLHFESSRFRQTTSYVFNWKSFAICEMFDELDHVMAGLLKRKFIINKDI